MKRILLTLSVVSSVLLFSCQKEVDFANSGNNTGGSTSGTLLVKRVDKTGSDSTVTTYQYNANKKLINQKITGVDQGSPVNTEYRYHRNSSGILTFYSVIDADLVSLGVDSVIIDVHYSSSKYTSYVTKFDFLSATTYIDSVVFVYDGSGKIIREDYYESPSGLGDDYILTGKTNFAYSGSNLSQFDLHDFDDTGAEVFFLTEKFSYDSKPNPLHFDTESFPMGHYEWISANNIAGIQATTSNGPPDDQTITYNYTYNSSDRPQTSSATAVPSGASVSSTYYYQ